MASHLDLSGLRVFVAEDDYFVVELLVAELESHGIEVVGPVSSVGRGLEVLDGEPAPDFALVDVNLGGSPAFPVIDRLLDRSVPVALVSGYDRQALPERYRGLPSRLKPYGTDEVLELIRARADASAVSGSGAER